jgi:transposase
MLGKRSDQRGLFEADHLYLDFVGRDSFYGFLARERGRLFRDEEFAALYVLDNGCPSVPPSLLATALLLQSYDFVSDEEAKARADFDLRWKVALGIELDARPFAKSTFQLFRSQLILHEQVGEVFRKSLKFARESGYLKSKRIKVALDTSNILGRGAVKDTYNLLSDGIVSLVRELALLAGLKPEEWATEHGLARYFATSSVKGAAEIDWEDKKARESFLGQIVADADSLLGVARAALGLFAPDSLEHKRVTEAARLLSQLLLQDVERRPAGGVAIKEGVARDRVISVHDPEMRHGRKSKAKRFDGHKAAIAVDTESQLITAIDVLAGNAPDNERALELVKESEVNAEVEVTETLGDCAYGDGLTRQEFADSGKRLVARVPDRPETGYFAKEDFQIDLSDPKAPTCTCPAGQIAKRLVRKSGYKDRGGKNVQSKAFHFDPALCDACPLRAQCVKTAPGKGRMVSLHPQERLLQEARAFQKSEEYSPYRKWRQVVEHRIARLMQLGVRQARYFGRAKTLFQLLLAATVANLTLVATRTGLMRSKGTRKALLLAQSLTRLLVAIGARMASSMTTPTLTTHHPRLRYLQLSTEAGCRLGF